MNDIAQLARGGLFDARPPRYTSYPTAPHFSAGVGGDAYGDWLGAVPEGQPVSIYAHIPFCRRLCWFCACRTQGAKSARPIERYLDTLLMEIAAVSEASGQAFVNRLHWGGGTPTILGPAQIRLLAQALRDAFQFSKNSEFSVEIDPNEIDAERLEALAESGMNRASIGVQDFEPNIQKAIGREQSYDVTAAAAEGLRKAGIRSLNADLVYGLPHQTEASLSRSVRRLLWLRPDRVALYGYAHVPTMARRQVMIAEETLPDARARFALFETAKAIFVEAGYEQIGIDHFALPSDSLAIAARAGRLRRNFQGYTDDNAAALIGLGASAISEFPEGYAQNAAATAEYQRRIRAGSFATARGHRLSAEDSQRKRIIEQLMCSGAADFSVFAEDHPLRRNAEAAARTFADATRWEAARLSIQPHARALTRIIAQAFDSYAPAALHSSAI